MHYPPDPVCRFVAYDSLDDGVRDYLVHFRAEFRAAWPGIEAGDPALFGHLLKLTRFYTAPEASYVHGLVACYQRLDTITPPDPPDPPPGIDPAIALAMAVAQNFVIDEPDDAA
jgi:hypothetical protein